MFGIKVIKPYTKAKKGILKVLPCNVDSKLEIKLEYMLCDWLGDQYRAASVHSLFLIFNSIVRKS